MQLTLIPTFFEKDTRKGEHHLRPRYDQEGEPAFASARLWDDGVIDPADTRRILGLSLAASLNSPIEHSSYGVFRM